MESATAGLRRNRRNSYATAGNNSRKGQRGAQIRTIQTERQSARASQIQQFLSPDLRGTGPTRLRRGGKLCANPAKMQRKVRHSDQRTRIHRSQ